MRCGFGGILTMFHSARHMPTRLRAASVLHDLGPLLAGTSGHRSRCNKQGPLRFPLQRASPCGAWRWEHEPIKELDDLWKTWPHSAEFAPRMGGPSRWSHGSDGTRRAGDNAHWVSQRTRSRTQCDGSRPPSPRPREALAARRGRLGAGKRVAQGMHLSLAGPASQATPNAGHVQRDVA